MDLDERAMKDVCSLCGGCRLQNTCRKICVSLCVSLCFEGQDVSGQRTALPNKRSLRKILKKPVAF